MSDHWNALARLLGAPGAASKTPTAPPVEKTEEAVPPPAQSFISEPTPVAEPPAPEIAPPPAAEIASSIEPPAFDASEKNWKSLAELLNLKEDDATEQPSGWTSSAPQKKSAKADPKGKKTSSKRKSSGFADGLGFETDDETCASDEGAIESVSDSEPFSSGVVSDLSSLLGAEEIQDEEPSLPGWETAEFGAPPPREPRERENKGRPTYRRSAFAEPDDVEEPAPRHRGGGRGRNRQDSRNQPANRDSSGVDPRDIDPRDIDPRSVVPHAEIARGGRDLDGSDIDPRDIDPRDVDPRESGQRGRRGRAPVDSFSEAKDDERGGGNRRRRRRRRGRGGNDPVGDVERPIPPAAREFPDDEVPEIEADDLWAEVGDDEEHDVRPPAPPARPKTPPRVTFDDDHEDAEEVVAMRRGRRRRRLSNEPAREEGPVAEAGGKKERSRDRAGSPDGRGAPDARRSGRRNQEERRNHEDISVDDSEQTEFTDVHEDIEPIASHRNIPTWLDAVDVLINANIESRRREPQRRGRGNGSQGGNGGNRRR